MKPTDGFCERQTVSGFIVDEKVEEYKNQKSFLFEVDSMNFDGVFVNSIREICFVGGRVTDMRRSIFKEWTDIDIVPGGRSGGQGIRRVVLYSLKCWK